MHVAFQAVLSLYASRRKTGTATDNEVGCARAASRFAHGNSSDPQGQPRVHDAALFRVDQRARHVRGVPGYFVFVCLGHTTGIVMDSGVCVSHIDVCAFKVLAMYEAILAILSLLASEHTTGFVMDTSDIVSHTVRRIPCPCNIPAWKDSLSSSSRTSVAVYHGRR